MNLLKGIAVDIVIANSAAEKAGLKPGDIILKVGDTDINYFFQLQRTLVYYRPGAVINVEILRNDKKQVLKVHLGEFSDP